MSPEQRQAWDKYRKDPSIKHRNALVEIYSSWTQSITSNYCRKRNLPLETVTGQAFIGLIDAIEKFDISKGFEFETFAKVRIIGSILDQARKEGPYSRRIAAIISRIKRTKNRGPLCENKPDSLTEVFEEHNVPLYMQPFITKVLGNKDLVVERDYIDSRYLHLAPSKTEPDTFENRDTIKKLFSGLLPIEKECMNLYWLEGMTMVDVGKQLGITESRVYQICTSAMKHLKNAAKH